MQTGEDVRIQRRGKGTIYIRLKPSSVRRSEGSVCETMSNGKGRGETACVLEHAMQNLTDLNRGEERSM